MPTNDITDAEFDLARAREAADDCGRGEPENLATFIEGLGARADQVERERDDAIRERRACHALMRDAAALMGQTWGESGGHPMFLDIVRDTVGERVPADGDTEVIEPIPGCWTCPRCGFDLSKNVISMAQGAIGADPRLSREECPNDGQLLVQKLGVLATIWRPPLAEMLERVATCDDAESLGYMLTLEDACGRADAVLAIFDRLKIVEAASKSNKID